MQKLVDDIAAAVRTVDSSGVPFKAFHPGVGPYGEPQLVKLIVQYLAETGVTYKGIKTCRTPDVLVPDRWALEFKIVRPFGDNGIEAEHWSQNLLHPYPGNVSAIGDAYKLLQHKGPERKGLIAVSYEHEPPKIDVSILVSTFEVICHQQLHIPLSDRCTAVIKDCVHPVHQRATVHGWELVGTDRLTD